MIKHLYIAKKRILNFKYLRVNSSLQTEESSIHCSNIGLFKHFLLNNFALKPRNEFKLSSKIYRKIIAEIKIARFLSLLPYCDAHVTQ